MELVKKGKKDLEFNGKHEGPLVTFNCSYCEAEIRCYLDETITIQKEISRERDYFGRLIPRYLLIHYIRCPYCNRQIRPNQKPNSYTSRGSSH